MTPTDFLPAAGALAELAFMRVTQRATVAHVQLARPDKRNAACDQLIEELRFTFTQLPDNVRVVVLSGEGEHFCAGLDLSEVAERSVAEGMLHSRAWHAAFERVQFGRVPVIAALHGAVVGGGLELAASAHVRVADRTAFYALPEGSRGIFVGGSGSVRIPRLIGVPRMTDMMLTGRVLDAAEGHAAGISNYLVEPGQALARAFELAERVAGNAPMSNFAVMHALPRIAGMSHDDGLFVEAVMSAVAQGEPEAKQRVRDFLAKRGAKVRRPE